MTFKGGPGNDDLTGGPARQNFGTMDMLDGGEGNDRLAGGDGDDRLVPGPGADVIDGGADHDHVSFAYATSPVSADLGVPGPTDPTGEGDAMTAVESLEAGAGNDVIAGGAGDSVLDGGPGDDVIDGRGGRDVIVAGAGADTVDGGAGDDSLSAGPAVVDIGRREAGYWGPDGSRDVVTGGEGDDVLRLAHSDRGEGGTGDDIVYAQGTGIAAACGNGRRDAFAGLTLPLDCERIMWFGSEPMSAKLRLRRGRLEIGLPGYFGGTVTVEVRVKGRLVARGRRKIEFEEWRTVRMRVTPRNQRALRRARSVRVRVGAQGPGGRSHDTAVLPAPR